VFGAIPADGTRFRVTYRLGAGRRDDVAAGVLTDGAALPAGVDAVTNPVPATGGRDPQPLDDARVEAPDAFRAVTYRAVRPEDYAEAVERLEWVQRAGASLRWTGSWLTLFAAADPRGATALDPVQETELTEQLDRFRQAGREAFGRPPRYADLDLDLLVCVAPSAYAGDVKAAVLDALVGRPQPCGGDRAGGLLHPDNFSFGTPLYRSALEAAVQDVPGVRAVEEIRVRRRGVFDWRPFDELVLRVAPDEVVRVAQDPLHPGRGSVRLRMEGGL
jgi:predicted phage baseplate assembly protein